jgi:hypothetical protein
MILKTYSILLIEPITKIPFLENYKNLIIVKEKRLANPYCFEITKFSKTYKKILKSNIRSTNYIISM